MRLSVINMALPFVLYDGYPCLTPLQCAEEPAVDKFVKRFRDCFEYKAAWDAYFLKSVPEGLMDALRGEDDGLM